ncbi:alpha/beta fold hydrolase [Sphingomonas xinjiangensis]|uniref:Polyhydroxyalkanoate synthase n=1 Tax=Sphingomonas xinjiangensis TaxID=643568 RepID=A0A840YDI1_9SPHN|nr:alpha/beta fold hydrolase [Sphingomonas xinjiangensis]MBB5710345.1 polyhydroxyalkanoate synthase [Sphingomonas xinjiangensis]
MLHKETAASPGRRAAALAGLRRYQHALRPTPRAPKPAIAAAGRARLLDYGGSGMPIVFVPSLINPPLVLDLARGNSLLRWLSRQGVRPMLVDWGTPSPTDRGMDITAHVERLLLPMLRNLARPPILVGYCLGGTLAIAAASAIRVSGLVTIAAPWRFAGYGDAVGPAVQLWERVRAASEQLGLMPMEVLQAGFWQLDPASTVAKFERFGRLPPASATARAFVALEDWANEGAPLTLGAASQLFGDFFTRDLPGTGGWQVEGRAVDPRALACPSLAFVSSTDRIAPASSAPPADTIFETTLGHVGMVVGSRARAALWQPLADWLSAVAQPR